MRIQTITELLEVYDFIRSNCRAEPLFQNVKVTRRFLEESLLIKGVLIERTEQKITAVCFVWPTSEIPVKNEIPWCDPEGKVLWCQYCFVIGAKRDGKIMNRFLEECLENYPFVEQLAYRRTKKDGRIYVRQLAKQVEEAVN